MLTNQVASVTFFVLGSLIVREEMRWKWTSRRLAHDCEVPVNAHTEIGTDGMHTPRNTEMLTQTQT